MNVSERQRRPPGQEEAPGGESGDPTPNIVGRSTSALNCSPAVRPATYIAPRAASIPSELKAIDHWVAWRFKARADSKAGTPKLTKIPIDPLTGAYAKSNTKTTWATFDQAWDRYERDHLDGVGFVLTLDLEIVGIDIDHCRDPETGVIDEEALAIVREIDSYAEISPSGTGIRIFARGTLPPGGRKKGGIEVYASGRFLTVTGAHVEFP